MLRGVVDPELGSDIVDLGMVGGVDVAPDGAVTVEVALTRREINPLYRGKQQLFLICQTSLLDLLHTAKKLRGQAVENHKFYGLSGLEKRDDRTKFLRSMKLCAKVRDVHGAQVGRWAWDVFLAH